MWRGSVGCENVMYSSKTLHQNPTPMRIKKNGFSYGF